MFAAFDVISLSFKRFNDGQQLAVVGLIPSLSSSYLFGEKSYQMLSAWIIRGQQTKNSINSIVRSIRLNLDTMLQIEMI